MILESELVLPIIVKCYLKWQLIIVQWSYCLLAPSKITAAKCWQQNWDGLANSYLSELLHKHVRSKQLKVHVYPNREKGNKLASEGNKGSGMWKSNLLDHAFYQQQTLGNSQSTPTHLRWWRALNKEPFSFLCDICHTCHFCPEVGSFFTYLPFICLLRWFSMQRRGER